MAQYLRPDGDDSWDNVNFSGPGFASHQIDESTPSDSDYVQGGTAGPAFFYCTLSNPSSTPGSGDHIMRIRYRVVNTGNDANLDVTLKDYSTGDPIASWALSGISNSSYTTSTRTLTSGEVTDLLSYGYDDLAVEVVMSTIDDPPEDYAIAVSWFEFEVPDGASTTGHPWFYPHYGSLQ